MRITKTGMCVLVSAAAAAGVCGVRYGADYINSERIKRELLEEVRKYDSFPSEMDIEVAEIREPFFNKADYWQVTADSIHREMKKRQ